MRDSKNVKYLDILTILKILQAQKVGNYPYQLPEYNLSDMFIFKNSMLVGIQ